MFIAVSLIVRLDDHVCSPKMMGLKSFVVSFEIYSILITFYVMVTINVLIKGGHETVDSTSNLFELRANETYLQDAKILFQN